MSGSVEILVISISDPAMIGIYEDDILIDTKISNGELKVGDFLLENFAEFIKIYDIKSVTYTNTPGSFMGIKLSYIILKTLSSVLNFELFAVNGFELNGGGAIRANISVCFIKDGETIKLGKSDKLGNFELPANLSKINKNSDILPDYIIGAV